MEEEKETDDNVLQKPKKPRTAKQVAAFERAQQKRLESLEVKREQIKVKEDEIKEIKKTKPLTKAGEKIPKPAPVPKPKPVKDESDDEEEQQVIIVKKKPKKKKPIVIYEDSESEEEEPIIKPPKLKRQVVETILPVSPTYHFKIVS